MLHFTLLGGLGVAVHGVSSKIAIPRRGLALLAYVLLHGGARLQRERVAVALWPDALESDARAKLRRMLYLVSQALPAANSATWLLTDASSIAWNAGIERSLDVEQLREAVAAEEPVDTVPLYGGDLLPDFDDEWLLPERDRLREFHVRNLERLARSQRSRGRYGEAIAATSEVLRLEPWREDVMRFAIEARIESGDRAGALAEYERGARRLRDELGVEPMPETAALRAGLLRTEAAPAAARAEPRPAVPAPRAAAEQAEPIFVGRERELATLADHYTGAAGGRGGLVLIGGESGVGKSELARRYAAAVADRGGLVLTAATTFIETRPYQPFVAALARALPDLESRLTPARRAALDRLLDGDAANGLGLHQERESGVERTRLFEAVAAALAALGSDAPVLLVLEDVHWASSDTIALLEYVSRRAARARLVVLATYRDGDVPRAHPLRALRRRLQEESLVAHLALGPLPPRDVQRYLEAVQGVATPDVAERVHAACGGLPLFMVELVAGAPDGGAVLPAAGLPSALRSTLAARLDGLPAEVRTLLEIAAVVGLGFDVELVVEVSGWSEAQTNGYLSVALAHRLVREATTGGYDFAHHLFRELVYDGMPAAKRARRHALVAAALAALHADSTHELASELGLHYERAGDRDRAIVALHAAARRALAVYAHDDAANFASRALDLGAQDGTAIELLLVREEASRFAGHRERQRADLERCEALAEPASPAAVRCEIVQRRVALEHAADPEREPDVLARFDRLAEEAGAPWLARAALARGRYEFAHGRHAAARALLEDAARRFELAADARGIFDSAMALSVCERLPGDGAESERHFIRAEAQLAALGDGRDLIVALHEERAKKAMFQERYAETAMWARRLLDAATETGDVGRVARAHRLLGGAAAWRLDVTPAYEHLARALELFQTLGEHADAYAVIALRGVLEMRIGRTAAAIGAFERAREIARAFELDFGDAACAVNLSEAYVVIGRYDDAMAAARQALDLAERIGATTLRAPALINLAVAYRESGRPLEAAALLREVCTTAAPERRPALAAEAWTELALTAARLEQTPEAHAAADYARSLLAELPQSMRLAAHYRTLALAYGLTDDEPASAAMMREGVDLVRAQLATFPDAASQAAFAAGEAHRALLAGAPDVFGTVTA